MKIKKHFKWFILTYLPLYATVFSLRCYFLYIPELEESKLTFYRVLIVFYYICVLVIAILDTLVMVKAVKMCEIFWIQCNMQNIQITNKHRCIILGMKIVSYMLFSGSILKDMVFPLKHVQIMVDDDLGE